MEPVLSTINRHVMMTRRTRYEALILAVHDADGLGVADFLDTGHGGDSASRLTPKFQTSLRQ